MILQISFIWCISFMNLTYLGIYANTSVHGMLICSFLNTSKNFVDCLSNLCFLISMETILKAYILDRSDFLNILSFWFIFLFTFIVFSKLSKYSSSVEAIYSFIETNLFTYISNIWTPQRVLMVFTWSLGFVLMLLGKVFFIVPLLFIQFHFPSYLL